MDHTLPLCRGRIGELDELGRELGAQPTEQVRPTDGEPPAIDNALDPVTGNRLESAGARDLEPALARARHHRPRDRVLGVLFDGGGEPERAFLGEAAGRVHAHDSMLAQSERPGLVEDHHGKKSGFLEPSPVPHQEPIAGAQRGRDGDDERHCEPQCVRAGDHKDGDEALDGERRVRTGREPSDESQRTRPESYHGEPGCGAVRQSLGSAPGPLRLRRRGA